MKFGILSRDDWNPEEEFYPNGTFVIVALEDTGAIWIDDTITQYSGMTVGSGIVYNQNGDRLGYVDVPASDNDPVVINGLFDTQDEAINYALDHYANDTIQVALKVNTELENNIWLDNWLDNDIARQLSEHWAMVLSILVGLLIIALILAYARLTGYHVWPLF
jgi:hypothetical protein